jgi:hypothetical protein
VLEAHRERLLAIPGVVGVGLGYRTRRDAVVSHDPAVVVYVGRKMLPATLEKRGTPKVPRSLRSSTGHRVHTDVVAFGTLRRHVNAGSGLGPATADGMGTIGTFAVDIQYRVLVALTAMHVTGFEECPPEPHVRIVSPSRFEGNPRPFGTVIEGTMSGIDAAKVSVGSPGSVDTNIREIGPVRGWRPLSQPGDRNTAVQMFGARTGRTVVGRIVEPSVELPAYRLDSAILVDIESKEGDSGAAIVDNEHLVLGLLVGRSSQLNNLRVFSPISRVLARLGCDIPSTT